MAAIFPNRAHTRLGSRANAAARAARSPIASPVWWPVMPASTPLPWSLVKRLPQQQVLPFAWVIGGEHFGNNPVLLDRIAAAKLYYLMEVPHDTLVWVERPATAVAPPTGSKG